MFLTSKKDERPTPGRGAAGIFYVRALERKPDPESFA
jgi:hypothetical protein